MINDLKQAFAEATYDFEGVDLSLRKDPNASKLLVGVTATGSVDLPGDKYETMIDGGFQWLKGLGKSLGGSGSSKKSTDKGGS